MRLVLVGGRTPLGAAVKTRLAAAKIPLAETVIAELDPNDEEGGRLLSEFAGEALMVVPVEEVRFSPADLVILCGEPGAMRPIIERASAARACIDASGASRRWDSVPWVHTGIPGADAVPGGGLLAAPQPVSATVAQILAPLSRDGLVSSAAVTVLLPASALGEKGAEELYQQSVGLLNFSELPQEQLAHPLAFHVVPWEDPSRPGSGGLAEELAGEVGRLLGSRSPGCDFQLLLAPTFHDYGYSIRMQTEAGATEEEISRRLEAAGVQVTQDGVAQASPGEALEGGAPLRVSRLRRAADDVVWAWAQADSLDRGAAENIARIAGRMVEPP